MKKILQAAIILSLSAGMPVFSQTLDIEYKSMLDRYTSKEMTQLEFKDLSFAWRDLMDSVGYPKVPYDSITKKVEYEFVSGLD
jgi:hypothetical protein